MKLYAQTNTHVLIDNNAIKEIGYTTKKLKLLPDGSLTEQKVVCFHFGTKQLDYFLFSNNGPTSQAISFGRPEYIMNIYQQSYLLGLSPSEFIDMVTEFYVLKELGF